MYLGTNVVFTQNVTYIHDIKLFNFLLVEIIINKVTYEHIDQSDNLYLGGDITDAILSGDEGFTVSVNDDLRSALDSYSISERERDPRRWRQAIMD